MAALYAFRAALGESSMTAAVVGEAGAVEAEARTKEEAKMREVNERM
jgi:hypothetical protein